MKTLKNFIYNIGYQILIIIVPLVMAPYVSRVVGPDGVGLYSYTYSIITLFGLFANLGMVKYGNREIARCREDRAKRSEVFAQLISIKLLCSAAVLAVYLCFANFWGGENTLAFYLQIPNLISFMLDISWLFFGMQKFRIVTAVCGVVKVITVVFIFCLVKSSRDTGIYILVLSVSAFVIQLTMWFFAGRFVDLKVSVRRVINRHWRGLLLLFFPVLAKYLYSTMDRIMLGNMVGLTEVGYYENVQSIILTVNCVLLAVGDVVMPRATLLYELDREDKVRELFEKTLHLISFLAAGAVFGLIGVSRVFIPFFYGDSFTSCVLLLQMAAPAVLFAGYADFVRNMFLLPKYRDSAYLAALVAGTVVNFIINFTLIPTLGSRGAVIGTVAAEFTVFVLQLFFCREDFAVGRFLRQACVYVLAGASILLPCHLISGLEWHPALLIGAEVISGFGIYALLVFLYIVVFERALWKQIKDIWRAANKRNAGKACGGKENLR